MSAFTLDTPVSDINGVGKVRAERLFRLGIKTIEDLIYHFPRAYERRGDIRRLSDFDPDMPRSYLLTVATKVTTAEIKRGLTISKFRAFDESGSVEIVYFNASYVKDIFTIGATFRFWGKIEIKKGRLQMINPKQEAYVEGIPLPDFVPVYPLTEGLSSKQLDKMIGSAINDVLPGIIDPIPENIRIENNLPTLGYAIKNAHFPDSDQALFASRKRLAFDEMLYFGIGISLFHTTREVIYAVRYDTRSVQLPKRVSLC
jgi:ATP-dependent DNA helicase RecG